MNRLTHYSLGVLIAFSAIAGAQDTTVVKRLSSADSLSKPPISARRAALYSLLTPGYGQMKLNRTNGAIVFAVAEVAFLGMARKSAYDLRDAKAARRDSVLVSFDNSGNAVYEQGRLVSRLKARRAHYEDWIAALIFNHLFSAADAFVAANLWDMPASVSMSREQGVTKVVAKVSF